jgi:hypothetical protein
MNNPWRIETNSLDNIVQGGKFKLDQKIFPTRKLVEWQSAFEKVTVSHSLRQANEVGGLFFSTYPSASLLSIRFLSRHLFFWIREGIGWPFSFKIRGSPLFYFLKEQIVWTSAHTQGYIVRNTHIFCCFSPLVLNKKYKKFFERRDGRRRFPHKHTRHFRRLSLTLSVSVCVCYLQFVRFLSRNQPEIKQLNKRNSTF